MDNDLKELIDIIEKITVHNQKYSGRGNIPWNMVNQKDVLKKRIDRRLKEGNINEQYLDEIVQLYQYESNNELFDYITKLIKVNE